MKSSKWNESAAISEAEAFSFNTDFNKFSTFSSIDSDLDSGQVQPLQGEISNKQVFRLVTQPLFSASMTKYLEANIERVAFASPSRTKYNTFNRSQVWKYSMHTLWTVILLCMYRIFKAITLFKKIERMPGAIWCVIWLWRWQYINPKSPSVHDEPATENNIRLNMSEAYA